MSASSRISSVILFFSLQACLPAFAQKHKQSDQEAFHEAQATENASGGNAAAEFVLGDSYEHGTGTPKDYTEALRWYLLSAKRGYAAAQVPLAWMYFNHGPSEVIEENNVEAYFWTDVALASTASVKQGGLSKASRDRGLLLRKMFEGGVMHAPQGDISTPALLSPERIAEAQARATKWFAEH